MKLKNCTCGKCLTTKNVLFNGIGELGNKEVAYFTCKECKSTMVLIGPALTPEIKSELKMVA